MSHVDVAEHRARTRRSPIPQLSLLRGNHRNCGAAWRYVARGSRRVSGLLISWNCHEPRRPLPVVTARKHHAPILSRDQRERFCVPRNRLTPIPWLVKNYGATSGVEKVSNRRARVPAPRRSPTNYRSEGTLMLRLSVVVFSQ